MTDELKINGKAIYTTKGAAREYGRIGCNFYTGCPHKRKENRRADYGKD